jgi:hypothetical protein
MVHPDQLIPGVVEIHILNANCLPFWLAAAATLPCLCMTLNFDDLDIVWPGTVYLVFVWPRIASILSMYDLYFRWPWHCMTRNTLPCLCMSGDRHHTCTSGPWYGSWCGASDGWFWRSAWDTSYTGGFCQGLLCGSACGSGTACNK